GLLALPGLPQHGAGGDGGGSYWVTFFPGIVLLGVGMGFTVAPLTASVMGSVDRNHSGVASGINNAVARAAGRLPNARLGGAFATRFNHALDQKLAALDLPPDVVAMLNAQRSKLAAADVPNAFTEARRAIDEAYVAGFRALMIACAVLAVAGGLCALGFVEKK